MNQVVARPRVDCVEITFCLFKIYKVVAVAKTYRVMTAVRKYDGIVARAGVYRGELPVDFDTVRAVAARYVRAFRRLDSIRRVGANERIVDGQPDDFKIVGVGNDLVNARILDGVDAA